MPGRDLVSCSFKMPDWMLRLQRGLGRLQLAIASDIQTNIGLRFDNEGAYNGHPRWKNLKSKANLRIAKNGLQERQILRKTGALKNSMSPATANGRPGPGGYVRIEGDLKRSVVAVGTRLAYARIHNEGGVIQHPGTKNGFGRGIKIPAHDIPIPRRNWTDWNSTDKKNMQIVIKNTITAILNGR